MKVMIVIEVMTGDVSPVEMFVFVFVFVFIKYLYLYLYLWKKVHT